MTASPVLNAGKAGEIRLAAGSDRDSLLYNAYHVLTQMAALYLHLAQGADAGGKEGDVLTPMSDDLVSDLGCLYTAWEGLDRQNAKPLADATRIDRLIRHTCKQFSTVISSLSEWTPLFRRQGIAILMEQRWQRILGFFLSQEGDERAQLTALNERSVARVEMLALAAKQTRRHRETVQEAFDAADVFFLDKSFGTQ